MVRAVLIIGAMMLGTVVASAHMWSDHSPELAFDVSVPDDLRALADETWRDFLTAHVNVVDCIAPLRLIAAWELDSRAKYRPDSAEAVIRVPGTPATLRSQMVHEFAHHVEHSCPAHAEIRPAFMEAQGSSPGNGWFEGASWKDTPSEQYAEATVEYVLGPRSHHGNIFISEEARELVRTWAIGPSDG